MCIRLWFTQAGGQHGFALNLGIGACTTIIGGFGVEGDLKVTSAVDQVLPSMYRGHVLSTIHANSKEALCTVLGNRDLQLCFELGTSQ